MRKLIVVLMLVLASASFGLISPELEQHLSGAQPDQRLMVHIVLTEQFDAELLNSLVDGMPKPERRMAVDRNWGTATILERAAKPKLRTKRPPPASGSSDRQARMQTGRQIDQLVYEFPNLVPTEEEPRRCGIFLP